MPSLGLSERLCLSKAPFVAFEWLILEITLTQTLEDLGRTEEVRVYNSGLLRRGNFLFYRPWAVQT